MTFDREPTELPEQVPQQEQHVRRGDKACVVLRLCGMLGSAMTNGPVRRDEWLLRDSQQGPRVDHQ